MERRPRILIGALSGWAYAERRQRCLSTWMADAYELKTPAFSCSDAPRVNTPSSSARITSPCHVPTTIRACPSGPAGSASGPWGSTPPSDLRSRLDLPAPCSPVPAAAWDYLFKCDDDTYVSIPRLLAYDTAGRDYIGAEWKPA